MAKITVTYEGGRKSVKIHKRDLDKLREALTVLEAIREVEGVNADGDAHKAAQHLEALLSVYGKGSE